MKFRYTPGSIVESRLIYIAKPFKFVRIHVRNVIASFEDYHIRGTKKRLPVTEAYIFLTHPSIGEC